MDLKKKQEIIFQRKIFRIVEKLKLKIDFYTVEEKGEELQAKYDFYIREDLMENIHYTKKFDGYMDRLDKYIDEFDSYGICLNAIGDITVFGGKSKREQLIIVFQKIHGRYTIHVFHKKRKTKDANIMIEWSARD